MYGYASPPISFKVFAVSIGAPLNHLAPCTKFRRVIPFAVRFFDTACPLFVQTPATLASSTSQSAGSDSRFIFAPTLAEPVVAPVVLDIQSVSGKANDEQSAKLLPRQVFEIKMRRFVAGCNIFFSHFLTPSKFVVRLAGAGTPVCRHYNIEAA